MYADVCLYECHKLSMQEYGKHEYHQLSITRFAWFKRPKSWMIPGKPYIGTEFSADYGNPGNY